MTCNEKKQIKYIKINWKGRKKYGNLSPAHNLKVLSTNFLFCKSHRLKNWTIGSNCFSFSSCPILVLLLTNISPVWQTFSLHLHNFSTFYELFHTRTRTQLRISQFMQKGCNFMSTTNYADCDSISQSVAGMIMIAAGALKTEKNTLTLTLTPTFTTRSALNISRPHLCMNWIRSNRIINTYKSLVASTAMQRTTLDLCCAHA